MINWLIRRRIEAFERTFDYDMSYARELLGVDRRAFLAWARVMGVSRYRRDVPPDVYYAAKLMGTVAEDCGPCTQLMVAMALREGVPPATLSAIIERRDRELSEQVLLGVRFAEAVLTRSSEADALRRDVVRRWGPRALVSLAFALTAARLYPTLKYALGYAHTCQKVVVQGQPLAVIRATA